MYASFVLLAGCGTDPTPSIAVDRSTHGIAFAGEPELGVACAGGEICAVGEACAVEDGQYCSSTRGQITCDDALDCPASTVCCSTHDPGQFFSETSCVEACAGAAVCTADADCAGGYCVRGPTEGGRVALGVCQTLPPTACQPGPGSRCERADLTGVDLYGADLTGSSFAHADLSGAQLQLARLTDADLRGVRLDGADMGDVRLAGADASGASLVGTRLSVQEAAGVVLAGANLTDGSVGGRAGDFAGADFSGARLVGTGFTGASDEFLGLGADLSGADLSGAIFLYVDLTGGSLAGATLSDTAWFDVVCPDGEFIDATGEGTCLGHE